MQGSLLPGRRLERRSATRKDKCTLYRFDLSSKLQEEIVEWLVLGHFSKPLFTFFQPGLGNLG